MINKCRHCGSEKFVKDGKTAGKQRFVCKECGRKFGGGIHSEERKAFALQMYMNNVGIRKIGLFCNVSHSLVLKWIKSAHKTLTKRLETNNRVFGKEPDIIEMDEIFTFVKKNGKEPSYGLLTVGDKSVLLRITSGTKA